MKENDRIPRSRSVARLPALGAFLLLLPAAWCAPRAHANPFDTLGLGARSAGMANAVTASADDFSASLYNPAGLAYAGGMELSIGYLHTFPSLETYWADQWHDANEDSIAGIVLGVVYPPFRFWKLAFVGGMGLFIPDRWLGRSLMLPYEQPRFVLWNARNQRLVLLSPNALKITDWLSIGAGFQLLIDTKGGPTFVLIEDIPANQGLYSEGTMSSTQKPVFSAFAGIVVEPWKDRLKLGFCFRDKMAADVDVPMYVAIDPLSLGLPIDILPKSSIDLSTPAPLFFSPRQFAFGLSVKPVPRLEIACDVTYQMWSEYINPAPEGYSVYSGGLQFLLRQNPNFLLPQGDFHDIWVPAIGAEVLTVDSRYVQLHLRAGYRYRTSPVPEQTGRAAFMDSDTHIIAGGFGLTFQNVFHRVMTQPFSLDMAVEYFHLEDRTYVREMLVAVSDRFGDLRFRGDVFNLEATLTFRF